MAGEAKRRKRSTGEFIKEHPWCCYCGARAETVDHCPPRAFFHGRQWPEGYAVPACHPCNQGFKDDDTVFAVLARIRTSDDRSQLEDGRWIKHVQGLKNNQRHIFDELVSRDGRNDQRRMFRGRFGADGDGLRKAGYGMAHVGPLTRLSLNRFGIRLAKALFFIHTNQLFNGSIWLHHLNVLGMKDAYKVIDQLLSVAPSFANIGRAGKSLHDQFSYRFNVSADQTPLLYAVVHFTDQMIFSIIAASNAFIISLDGGPAKMDTIPVAGIRVDAPLGGEQTIVTRAEWESRRTLLPPPP